jgi:DNA-binding beta-propeller fold protein YncE
MKKPQTISWSFPAVLAAVLMLGSVALTRDQNRNSVNGTIWVANRGSHTIRGFDAVSGAVVRTVTMAANSQPGDLAYAKGYLYVAEEFATNPAIAIVDPETGQLVDRIFVPPGSRPHHVHASNGGNLISAGLFGTDLVAVVDTHSNTLLGPWDSHPLTTNGRVHAGVFSQDGHTLYLAIDVRNEVVAIDPFTGVIFWRMTVPGAHELAVAHDGKTAYVTRRSANQLAVINLDDQTYADIVALGLPDTMQLSANEHLLTIGLRTSPAQLAVIDTRTFVSRLVNLSATNEAGTIAGHQWTSPSGRYTFVSYEGGTNPGVAVIDHGDDHRVIQRLGYSGRPHGVEHVR